MELLKTPPGVIRETLRALRFNTMAEAKAAIVHLTSKGVLTIPTVNDLMRYLDKEELRFGDDWGWPDLYYDMLSNKYGAAARYNRSSRTTTFTIQLPPPEHLIGRKTNEASK